MQEPQPAQEPELLSELGQEPELGQELEPESESRLLPELPAELQLAETLVWPPESSAS